jgi:23S rRNA (cytosine1962-C5)-methyltransferase
LERLQAAWATRQGLLQGEDSNCYRVFHGVAEGFPGLALDRYGELALVQVFRELPEYPDWEQLLAWCQQRWPCQQMAVWRRPPQKSKGAELLFGHGLGSAVEASEMGQRFLIDSHHRGLDPHLFLDLRAARRYLRAHCQGARVLNLFAYTCGAGLAAEAGGASEVLNVDFSASALERGQRNAQLNNCQKQSYVCQEVYPVIWQLAGRPLPGRARGKKGVQRLEARKFDLIFLDPPARSKGFFGAVDVENDYPSLLNPCLQMLAPQARILACNNLARVSAEQFRKTLERSCNKLGVELKNLQQILPEADFPSIGPEPALKMILLQF